MVFFEKIPIYEVSVFLCNKVHKSSIFKNSRKYDIICKKCDVVTNEYALHLFCHCPVNERFRNCFWPKLIALLGRQQFSTLYTLDITSQLIECLRGFIMFDITDVVRIDCFHAVLNFIVKIYG